VTAWDHRPRKAAEKLNGWQGVSGHDFSRANKASKAAEKLGELRRLKGHEFIRANKSNQFSVALATEGRSLSIFLAHETFSATCLAVPIKPARLRKNSASFDVLKGHEFIRANKSNQFSVALATEGRSLSIFLAHETFSATCLAVPGQAIGKEMGFSVCVRTDGTS
jgi:hypothetical protein